MVGSINYEVYINQNGAWDIVGRYPANRSEAAIEEAKRLEFMHRKPTKVVCETYDEETQLFHEKLIYISRFEKPSEPRGLSAQTVYGGGFSGAKKQSSAPKKKEKETQSFTSELFTLLSLLFLSLMLAAVASWFLMKGLMKVTFLSQIPYSQYTIAILIFVFIFIFLAWKTSANLVDWDILLGEKKKKSPPAKGGNSESARSNVSAILDRERRAEQRRRFLSGSSFFSRLLRHLFDFFDSVNGRKTMSERLIEEEKKKNPQTAEMEAQPPEPTEEIDYGDSDPKETEQPEKAEEKAEKKEEENKPDDDSPLPERLSRCNLSLLSFLSAVLQQLKQQNILINSYVCFGLELILSGAIENIAQNENLSDDDRFMLLKAQMEVLGRNKEVARLFFSKLNEYALEPNYLAMIEGGTRAFALFKEDPHSEQLSALVYKLMQKWIDPNKKSDAPGVVTVMFTDIVGSTSMTETIGDKMAQEIIRRHNVIVRKALENNNGVEIKHTGDGIMASFAWATNALDAAIFIQKTIARYNREQPTMPFHLRIGLNTGEPIVENNDLYGLTVQKAARICAEAAEDQILVASVLKELSAGKNYNFIDMGSFTLKGISEPQQLYSVVWKQQKSESSPVPPPAKEQQSLDQVLPEF